MVKKLIAQKFCFRFWNDSAKVQGLCLLRFDDGLLHWIFFNGSYNVFFPWLALVSKSSKHDWNFLYTLYLV